MGPPPLGSMLNAVLCSRVVEFALSFGGNVDEHDDCVGLQEGVATWGGTSFSQDQDGQIAHKFRKLMGMKEGEDDDDEEHPANEEQQLKQQQLFDQLDKEYEFARMTTHTHRGIGLGFQSLGLPDN